jgi:rhodanese-related sulfurtransferase
MSVLLGCWVLATSAILIWCSLKVSEGQPTSRAWRESTRGHLEHIPISPALLEEWARRDEHLIIMDLRSQMKTGEDLDCIPGSLRIPPTHLRSYFSFLPRNTRLVLCDRAYALLDTGAESLLLKMGIDAVYILEESAGARRECVRCHRDGVTVPDSRARL